MNVAKVSEIISQNNVFWSSIFYTESHVCRDYQIHLTPELKDLQFLNSASIIRNPQCLSEIEEHFEKHSLDCSIFTDSFTPLTQSELSLKGYIYDESGSEVWRSLDLTGDLPEPELFLKDTQLESIDVAIADFAHGPSGDLNTFIEISLEENGIEEASSLVLQNILAKANPNHFFPLVLSYDKEPAATLGLGIYPPYAFICLCATKPAFRGKGFFPYLRIKAAHIARGLGCTQIISNTEAGNTVSLAKGAATGFQTIFYQPDRSAR
jgi:GNAT superfamily N-acetyltransferase